MSWPKVLALKAQCFQELIGCGDLLSPDLFCSPVRSYTNYASVIYAPRDLQELQVVCRIIEAATWWVSGSEVQIEIVSDATASLDITQSPSAA